MNQSLATGIISCLLRLTTKSLRRERDQGKKVNAQASLHQRDMLTIYNLPLVVNRGQSFQWPALGGKAVSGPYYLYGAETGEGQEVNTGIG